MCRSVCVYVWKMYCGKVADWIGVVSGVSRGMGVLDGVHVGGDTFFPNYFGEDFVITVKLLTA